MNKTFFTKKMKYGSIAIVLTAVFCAVIILVNAILSAIDSKVGLYFDMTNEQIYEISEASREALNGIDKNKKIEIIFCQVSDKLEDDWYLSKVKTLAENYAKEFKNISVLYADIAADPTIVYPFKTTSATNIPNTSVIVNCPSTGAFKVFARSAFYSIAQSDNRVFGFNGEMRFTSAFLYVARQNNPVALFTTGHGESYASQSIFTMLENAGYTVKSIDLSTEEIDENASLIVISNPQNDFLGLKAQESGQTNEIDKLNKFVTEKFGNLMIFLNPKTPALPELSEFMGDDFGIGYTPGRVVVEGRGNSLDADGYAIIGKYSTKDDFSLNLHKQISTLASAPKTVSEYTTPLNILFESKDFTETSVALYSSDESQSIDSGKVIKTGKEPLVALSTYSKTLNNQEKNAQILVFGSAYFVDDLYVNSSGASSYGNSDVFYSALKLMGSESSPISIKTKVFDDTSLSVDQTSRKNITLVLSLILPLIVLAIGTVVWFRRKRF